MDFRQNEDLTERAESGQDPSQPISGSSQALRCAMCVRWCTSLRVLHSRGKGVPAVNHPWIQMSGSLWCGLGVVTRLSRELTHHIMSDPYQPSKSHASLNERPTRRLFPGLCIPSLTHTCNHMCVHRKYCGSLSKPVVSGGSSIWITQRAGNLTWRWGWDDSYKKIRNTTTLQSGWDIWNSNMTFFIFNSGNRCVGTIGH